MSSIALAVLWSFASNLMAQASPADPGEVGHLAEVSGDDVYVRSGPGDNYYPVAKVSAGARLRVFDNSNGWSAIEPPPGCFSLIHKNFVDLDSNGSEGTVNGDRVLVRAGSEMSPQLYTKQCKLDRGALVSVLSPHNGDYLRIFPPDGVRVYISSQFVRRIRELQDGKEPAVSSMVGEQSRSSQDSADFTTASSDTKTDSTGDASQAGPSGSPVGAENPLLTSAEEMIHEEELKPLLERDYERVISRLRGEKGPQKTVVASSYAKVRMAQLLEAARTVSLVQEVRELGEEMSAERKAAQMQREKMRPLSPAIGGGFDAVGELRLSMLYASNAFPNRYRLVEVDGERTIGYVEIPRDLMIDVDRFVGRRVGVRARDTRLQAEDVDPLMVYTVSELVLLDSRTDE